MNNMKEQADKLLYDLGLLDELKKYGTPHIIGSYAMNVMAGMTWILMSLTMIWI